MTDQFSIIDPRTGNALIFDVPREATPEVRAEIERMLPAINAEGDLISTLIALGIIGAALCVTIKPRDARTGAKLLTTAVTEQAARWQIAATVGRPSGGVQ